MSLIKRHLTLDTLLTSQQSRPKRFVVIIEKWLDCAIYFRVCWSMPASALKAVTNAVTRKNSLRMNYFDVKMFSSSYFFLFITYFVSINFDNGQT